jgi:protein gp37
MSTKINWCDETWNPVSGCTPAGVGCAHCYAKRVAERFPAVHGVEYSSPSLTSTATCPTPFSTVICHPERLGIPERWRKPRAIMCPSMGDLFHEDVLGAFKFQVFQVMERCPQHTFIILTKRPQQMREDMLGLEPPANVVLGVSCSTQAEADHAIPILLDTPANRRVVSLEPLVGPVDLYRGGFTFLEEQTSPRGTRYNKLDGVIVGGESGPGARPMHPDWVRSLRDQCEAAGVPFFFKQWGDGIKKVFDSKRPESYKPRFYAAAAGWDARGKHGGRLLDGRTHDALCWDVAGKGEA